MEGEPPGGKRRRDSAALAKEAAPGGGEAARGEAPAGAGAGPAAMEVEGGAVAPGGGPAPLETGAPGSPAGARAPSPGGAPKPLKRLKVCYFHDPELSVFDVGREHRHRPFRGRMAHALLCSYGFYPHFLEPIHPRLATRTDLGQFHSDAYIEVLATAQKAVERAKSAEWEGRFRELVGRFGLALDGSPHAVFPGLLDYCRLMATGSLGCAANLCSGEANVAINWYGGQANARSSMAQNGCYVNDCVLATLQLLARFRKVLYVNLSGVHCDAVEQAFYTTPRVLTVSFHAKLEPGDPLGSEFPGTGDIADCGVDDGEGFVLNVPVEPGIDDKAFVPLFRSIVAKLKQHYSPDAVVVQCGAGLLAGERDGLFYLTCRGYGDCVRQLRDLEVPLLLLGGPGASLALSARLWAYLTTVVLGLETSLPNIVPEDCAYRDYYAPAYEAVPPRADIPEDVVSPKALASLRRKIMNQIERLKR